jgi:NACalpha-BTF3-like transcription factor
MDKMGQSQEITEEDIQLVMKTYHKSRQEAIDYLEKCKRDLEHPIAAFRFKPSRRSTFRFKS